MTYEVELAYEFDAELGEGPIWDDIREELLWLDVTRGKILFFSPSRGVQNEIQLDRHIGSLALTRNLDLCLALRDGFAHYSFQSQSITSFTQVIESDEVRFNDGAVDRRGRFLAGTMGYNPKPDTGNLYTFTEDSGYRLLIPEVGVSNGICWNKDSSKMYFIDSITQSIQVFDYDLNSGSASNPRVLIEFKPELGIPDGMTIDEEGSLWVAMWDGSQILKISSDGDIEEAIKFPVSRVTSLAFGGADLRDLYVTSAQYELSSKDLADQPLAGSLFKVRAKVPGNLENRMK
jgi:sugar lactone lactonase YvrE